MPKKHDPKKREREKMACQRSMTQQIKSDTKRSVYYLCTNLISHKYEYTPVDPIFDLATDLGQANDILPHPSKLHLYHQIQ